LLLLLLGVDWLFERNLLYDMTSFDSKEDQVWKDHRQGL
jgi:hypothetical protein